jgi:type I restriction enzyme S subunit
MAGDVVATVYGPMSAKLAKSSLADLCLPNVGIQTGPFGSQLHASDYVEYGTPIITVEHLGENRIIHSNLPRVTDEDKERLSRYKLITGDIVFSRVGSVDRRAIVHPEENDWLLSGRCLRVRPDRKKIDPSFLSWFFGLPTFQEHIRQIAVGATMPSLNTKILGDITIYYPSSLKEQQAIACILGALDDKIELNRKMNRTLEAMAQAIFKSWFVDFDPVRAKATGRSPDLSKKIAYLFPDSFQDSELGKIPRGWCVTSLADQVTAGKGLSYKGQHLCDSGVGMPMHNLNSVYEGGGYKHEGLKWYNGEYRSSHLLKPGDVIVTNTEQGFDYLLIGFAAIVPEQYGSQGLFSHHIFRIQPRATSYLPAWFTYLLLRTRRFHDIVAGHSNGTTVNMLPLDGLQKPQFVLPPKEIVGRFGHLFKPIQQRLEKMHDEDISLAALRDTLLPKLISGELQVQEVDRIVGRC